MPAILTSYDRIHHYHAGRNKEKDIPLPFNQAFIVAPKKKEIKRLVGPKPMDEQSPPAAVPELDHSTSSDEEEGELDESHDSNLLPSLPSTLGNGDASWISPLSSASSSGPALHSPLAVPVPSSLLFANAATFEEGEYAKIAGRDAESRTSLSPLPTSSSLDTIKCLLKDDKLVISGSSEASTADEELKIKEIAKAGPSNSPAQHPSPPSIGSPLRAIQTRSPPPREISETNLCSRTDFATASATHSPPPISRLPTPASSSTSGSIAPPRRPNFVRSAAPSPSPSRASSPTQFELGRVDFDRSAGKRKRAERVSGWRFKSPGEIEREGKRGEDEDEEEEERGRSSRRVNFGPVATFEFQTDF